MAEKGVYYIATGEKFLSELKDSLDTLEQNYDVKVAVASDKKIEHEMVDQWIPIEDPDHGFKDKIEFMKDSPFDKTVFLDTDTFVYNNFDEVFELLDRFEIAAAHAEGRIGEDVDDVPDSFPEFNTGVIAYRKNQKVLDLYEEWMKIYTEEDWPCDQAPFRKAAYSSDVDLYALTPEYNCRFVFPTFTNGEIKIFHGRLYGSRSLVDPLTKWNYTHQDLMSKINGSSNRYGMRLTIPRFNRIKVYSGGIFSIYRRLVSSVSRDGLVETVKKLK
jgi:hypothetical protein